MSNPQVDSLELLVLQPTTFCNINCSYCYLPHRDATNAMSLRTVQAIADRIAAYPYLAEDIPVVWHAGEPLAAKLSFYEEALHILSDACPTNHSFRHTIQTNGMLINDEWCEFFTSNQIRIGLSIDGPKKIHDANRQTRRGLGTFDAVMNGVKTLQRHRINFYNIAVVTREALPYADDVFNFFLDNGIMEVGLNFEEIEGANKKSDLLASVYRDDVAAFVDRFTERAITNRDKFRFRELDGFEGAIQADTLFRRQQTSRPGAIISIDHAGNFSTFSPELLGQQVNGRSFSPWNVFTHSLAAMFEDADFKNFATAIESGLNACQATCEYFGVCGGGEPSNKWFENKALDSTETLSCAVSIKCVAEVLLTRLEREITETADPL